MRRLTLVILLALSSPAPAPAVEQPGVPPRVWGGYVFYTTGNAGPLMIGIKGTFDRPPFYWDNEKGEVEDPEAAELPEPVHVYLNVRPIWSVTKIQNTWRNATGGLGMTCSYDPSQWIAGPNGPVYLARKCWGDNPQQTDLLTYLDQMDAVQWP